MRAEVVQTHLFAIFKVQRFDLDQLYVRLQISRVAAKANSPVESEGSHEL
jgi:hypothetical protein